MKKLGALGAFVCADGKFFVKNGVNAVLNVTSYRQIELYLPGSEGCMGEPLQTTMDKWLLELHTGERAYKWAVGSTGGQLTARYVFREDGELISVLAMTGGIK